MMTYKIDTKTEIVFGHEGEKGFRSIEFDVSDFPTNGTITLEHLRYGDTSAYPITLTRVGNVASWTPNSTDTALKGAGRGQLVCTVGSTIVAKTDVFKLINRYSLADVGTVPSGYDNWLASLEALASQITTAKNNALGDIGTAKTTAINNIATKKTEVVTELDGYVAAHHDALKGAKGDAGNSAKAVVEQTSTGAVIYCTDEDGTTTATVNNGSDYVITEADKTEIAEEVESLYTDDLNELKEDLNTLRVKKKWNLAEDGEVIHGKMCNSGTQTVGNAITLATYGSGYTVKFDVSNYIGEYLYFICEKFATQYGSTGYNGKNSSRFLCFADSDDKYISGYSYPQPELGAKILIPTNSKYAYITFIYKDGTDTGYYWATTKSENNHIDAFDLSNNVKARNDIDVLVADVDILKNSNSAQAIRKPTFSFIFDDGTNGDTNIKVLFDSYGFKCGFGIVANSNLANIKDRYLSYQNDGYEILSHSTDGVAMKTMDSATAEAKLKNSLEILTENGYDVSGFVTPSTWLSDEAFAPLKKYYQYGFGHLVSAYSTDVVHTFYEKDVRQLERWSLQSNTVEQTLAKIDSCISNNGYMCFYGHSYPSSSDNMTVENMNTILAYLKTKVDNGEIIVDIPRNAINDYYSVRHSDLLELYNR